MKSQAYPTRYLTSLTGGGASLELLGASSLPGVAALNPKQCSPSLVDQLRLRHLSGPPWDSIGPLQCLAGMKPEEWLTMVPFLRADFAPYLAWLDPSDRKWVSWVAKDYIKDALTEFFPSHEHMEMTIFSRRLALCGLVGDYIGIIEYCSVQLGGDGLASAARSGRCLVPDSPHDAL